MQGTPIYGRDMRLPGTSMHAFMPPPAPPPPGVVVPMPGPSCPHIELPHEVEFLMSGKMTTDVIFDGYRAAKKGHSTGAGIPHFPVVANPALALTMAFSKYKFLFGAEKIQVNGVSLGFFCWPMTPPFYCSTPCAMPATVLNGLLQRGGTVLVGFEVSDVVAGWASGSWEMFTDLLFTFLFSAGGLDKSGASYNPSSILNSLFRHGTGVVSATFKAGGDKIAKMLVEPTAKVALQELGRRFAEKVVQDAIKKAVKSELEGKPGVIGIPIIDQSFDPFGDRAHLSNPLSKTVTQGDPSSSAAPADQMIEEGAPHAA